jgi:hypothetical protein
MDTYYVYLSYGSMPKSRDLAGDGIVRWRYETKGPMRARWRLTTRCG